MKDEFFHLSTDTHYHHSFYIKKRVYKRIADHKARCLCGSKVTVDASESRTRFLARTHTVIMGIVLLDRDSMKSTPTLLVPPAQTRIIRAVASSTAIETGQSIKELEALLKAQSSKYQQLSLAAAVA